MQASKYNILTRIEGSDEYIIVNILSGHADIFTEAETNMLGSPQGIFADKCAEKGYWVDPVREEMEFKLKYIDFLETRDQEEVQVFFVPSYSCNFGCSYCYQSGYVTQPGQLASGMADAFFHFINHQIRNRKYYITLFGGEPLMQGRGYQESLVNFMERCSHEGSELAIVTNGYHLDIYLNDFQRFKIREIQITLDGTRDIHNKRRPLKNGKPTFDKVVENLERCLDLGFQVNLRVVLDRQNIDDLPHLARYAADRGWTKSPLFKTQLGRNYELHDCQSENNHLFSRIDLYKALHRLILRHPEIAEFHKPAFSVMGFLFNNGRLPDPLFDACPGCKSEWALDYTGKVFSCTATVGKEDEELGTFYPELLLNHQLINSWQKRDITTIKECFSCNLQLACGGGCGSLAKNRSGNLLMHDCRPVKEQIGLGASFYFS